MKAICSDRSAIARVIMFVVVAVVMVSARPVAQKATLPDVLKAAATYIRDYSDLLQAVTAEEDYLQLEVSGGRMRVTRKLLGDVVFAGIGEGRVTMFRDVYSIDANPLHERDGRLFKLFQSTSADALLQAQELSRKSTLQYVSRNLALFDDFLAPLAALRAENQSRVTFKLENIKTSDGVDVASVKFSEAGEGRVINSPIPEAATGRLFIEVATGRVRRTELVISNKLVNLRTTVIFAPDAALKLWLPKSMSLQSDITSIGGGNSTNQTVGTYNLHESLEAQATYSKYQWAALAFKVRSPRP